MTLFQIRIGTQFSSNIYPLMHFLCQNHIDNLLRFGGNRSRGLNGFSCFNTGFVSVKMFVVVNTCVVLSTVICFYRSLKIYDPRCPTWSHLVPLGPTWSHLASGSLLHVFTTLHIQLVKTRHTLY